MKGRQMFLAGLGLGIGIAVVMILVFKIYFFTPRQFARHRSGHGVLGTIDSLANNQFTVKDRFGASKTIFLDDKTILRQDGSQIKFSDLKKGNRVIVIGRPLESKGAITAKVVRLYE